MEDAVELPRALLRLRRASGLPVAFASLPAGPARLRIVELSGNATEALRGLAVASGSGLGGKAAALSRPLAVSDYHNSRTISHEYDGAVRAEGLCSVLAVPVVVGRNVRAVLYGALREPLPLGDRTLEAAVAVARRLEQSLAVRDEQRRAEREAAPPQPAVPGSAAAWESVRAAHGRLRLLAQQVPDPELRGRLQAVCEELAAASGGGVAGPAVPLSPRELDVLAQVAAGATNAGTAAALGVRPETVKSYLRSGMRKLGAHTRLEAVVAARRAGLLP